MYMGNLILLILNVPLVGLFVNLLRIPFRILFPIIMLVCLVGTYSLNSSGFELLVLLASGMLGYIFRKLQYDLAPFILALILGPVIEISFRQSLIRSGGDFSIFWNSPLALTIILFSCFLFLWNVVKSLRPMMVRPGS